MSVKYLLPCACGEKTLLEAGQAGQRLVCACGATLVAPTMRGMSALERSTVAEAKPAAARRKWSRAQGGLFSGGVIVTLLSLITAGYFGMVYAASQDKLTQVRDRLDAVTNDQSIDDLAASDLLTEWKNMVAGGLEEPVSVQWQETSQLARNMTIALGIALGVALAGIVTSAGALFWRPRVEE